MVLRNVGLTDSIYMLAELISVQYKKAKNQEYRNCNIATCG